MKICVAGLGLIGGSLCMSLKRAGYKADGWNRSEKPLKFAIDGGVVDGVANNFEVYDVVFIALPYAATIEFIENTKFKNGAIVSDICGVKKPIEAAIYAKQRGFHYVGCHPMAGKEVSGIENACADLFDGKSMIVTRSPKTDGGAYQTICALTKAMGFKYIVTCSSEVHDRKIAYTSQLAHVVSNAYVKDTELENCVGFTGGSFQDMTRIAGVDEGTWSELYLANAENLTRKISSLISSLEEIKEKIISGDRSGLEKALSRGRLLFENCNKVTSDGDITVSELK